MTTPAQKAIYSRDGSKFITLSQPQSMPPNPQHLAPTSPIEPIFPPSTLPTASDPSKPLNGAATSGSAQEHEVIDETMPLGHLPLGNKKKKKRRPKQDEHGASGMSFLDAVADAQANGINDAEYQKVLEAELDELGRLEQTSSHALPYRTSANGVEDDDLYVDEATGKKKKKKKKKKAAANAGLADHGAEADAGIQASSDPKKKDKIWSNSNNEERERIKDYWLSLGEEERRSLVKIEKETVLSKMKEQQKHSCSCSVCGRKRSAIEEELEVLYDAYYEELEQYANEQQSFRPSLSPRSSSSLPLPSRATLRELDDEDPLLDEDATLSDDDETEEDEEPHGHISDGGPDFFNFGNSLTVKGGILTVADDLLKNDGKKFIEMMEQLAERRMQREEEAAIAAGEYDDEDDDFDDDEDDDYDYDEDYEVDAMTEEQRMEEGRRMFQIFAARMFEQRVLTAYRERIAQERQERLLEELEEESRVKEEREQKKAKENQKKKDKKRLQRLAKEEEKAKRDAERAAEEALLKAQEEQKAEEARKRKEEIRLKREAERKAIEDEKQRKEEDKRRRQAAEREREADKERKRKEQMEAEKKRKEDLVRKEMLAKERIHRDQQEKEKEERELREQKLTEEQDKIEATRQASLAKLQASPRLKDLSASSIAHAAIPHTPTSAHGRKSNASHPENMIPSPSQIHSSRFGSSQSPAVAGNGPIGPIAPPNKSHTAHPPPFSSISTTNTLKSPPGVFSDHTHTFQPMQSMSNVIPSYSGLVNPSAGLNGGFSGNGVDLIPQVGPNGLPYRSTNESISSSAQSPNRSVSRPSPMAAKDNLYGLSSPQRTQESTIAGNTAALEGIPHASPRRLSATDDAIFQSPGSSLPGSRRPAPIQRPKSTKGSRPDQSNVVGSRALFDEDEDDIALFDQAVRNNGHVGSIGQAPSRESAPFGDRFQNGRAIGRWRAVSPGLGGDPRSNTSKAAVGSPQTSWGPVGNKTANGPGAIWSDADPLRNSFTSRNPQHDSIRSAAVQMCVDMSKGDGRPPWISLDRLQQSLSTHNASSSIPPNLLLSICSEGPSQSNGGGEFEVAMDGYGRTTLRFLPTAMPSGFPSAGPFYAGSQTWAKSSTKEF